MELLNHLFQCEEGGKQAEWMESPQRRKVVIPSPHMMCVRRRPLGHILTLITKPGSLCKFWKMSTDGRNIGKCLHGVSDGYCLGIEIPFFVFLASKCLVIIEIEINSHDTQTSIRTK